MANFATLAEQQQDSIELLNISDAGELSIDMDIKDMTFAEGTDKEFSAYVVEKEGKYYRVPKSVLYQVKALMHDDKKFKSFKVIKTGSGMKTQYTVKQV